MEVIRIYTGLIQYTQKIINKSEIQATLAKIIIDLVNKIYTMYIGELEVRSIRFCT